MMNLTETWIRAFVVIMLFQDVMVYGHLGWLSSNVYRWHP